EIVLGLEAVDHGRGSAEQARELHLCRGLDLGEMLALYFFLLARCFGQDTLYDVGHFSGLGTGFSILASAAAAISAYFLGAVMGDLIFGRKQTKGTARAAGFCQW